MPTHSGDLIYLGRLSKRDTSEANFSNENLGAITGTYDSSVLEVVTVTGDDANSDGSITSDDGGSVAEQLTYTVGGSGVTTTYDAEAFYNVNLTLADGSIVNTNITVIQAENGDTFAQLPDDITVQSIELVSGFEPNAIGNQPLSEVPHLWFALQPVHSLTRQQVHVRLKTLLSAIASPRWTMDTSPFAGSRNRESRPPATKFRCGFQGALLVAACLIGISSCHRSTGF